MFREQNASTSLKFTYTPMHGVGYPFFTKAMEVFGFGPFFTVAEQVGFAVTVVVMYGSTSQYTHLTESISGQPE